MAEQQTINKVNGVDVEVLQTAVNNFKHDPDLGKHNFHVKNKWINGTHNRTMISSFYGAKQKHQHKQTFEVDCDEPPVLAGFDQAPNPVEHLLNSLAGCVTTSMVAHAAVRGINIQELESEVEGDIDLRGFLGVSPDTPRGFTNIRVKFRVKADTDNMKKLKDLAEYSPTFNTLMEGVTVELQVEPK